MTVNNMQSKTKQKRQKKDQADAGGSQQQKQQANNSDSSDDELIDEEEGGMRIGGVYIPPAPPAICSTDYNGPRVVISHIVNENFKSYAGRVVLGPFHKNFTSIVGPNGSGKSNVIDSMLFVFGYRATKIRSKKISVLLHKSENHQNVRSCTVAVHFIQIKDIDDTDFEVIPNSEIVIARTAFADNSSFYTINGKRSQFKEVATVLRTYGIDLVHNRFLILQGEVEQIAMMKPKAETKHDTGMLEYLEDIIGTTRYKKPIEKLGEKVNLLYEERQAKVAKVKAAEKERDVLRQPMTDAIDFLKKENKKTMIWNASYQKQIYDLKNQLKNLEQEKKEFDKKMQGIKDQLKETHDNRTTKEKELSAKHKEIDVLRNEKERLSEKFRKIDKRAAQLKEEISQTNKKRKKAIETKKQDEAKVVELENLPEKNQKEIEELTVVERKLVAEREKEQIVVEDVMANLKLETKELQEVKDGLSNTLIGLKKAKDEAKSKYDMSKFELDMYLSNEQKEIAKLNKLKETLEKTSKSLEKRKMDIEALKTKIPEGKKQLKAAQEELNVIRKEEPIALQELHRIKTVVNEKRHSLQANRSRGRVLDFIMKQKSDGHLPGVFGRLGDLGGIDAKFDVAVSTACGPLDSIVVDTIKTGKDCVEALKRSNIGRANFIALEVQEKLRSSYQRPIKTPENVPRLFDLINVPDDRVKPAFYYALRDTLVATDMEQAIRVAYGSTRYRVVTLSGEIIEISGTMSGGGNQKLRGRMGRSVVPTTDLNTSNLELMENQAVELQEKITKFHQKQSQLEDTISTLSRDIQHWEMDLKSFNFEIQGLSQQEPLLKQQVKEQEQVVKSAAPDENTVKKMTEDVNKLKKVLDKETNAANEIEEEVAKVTAKIEEVTGGKMKAAQQKLDAVTKKLDKVRAEITKLKVAINTAARNLKKTQDHLKSLTAEIKGAEETLLKSEAENKDLMKQGSEVNSEVKTIYDKIEEHEAVIKKLRSEIDSLVKEENKINTMKLSEDQNVESTTKSLQETKAAIPGIQKKLSSLKLNEIPGEEDTEKQELLELPPEELEEVNLKDNLYKITQIDEKLSSKKPNLKAIADYEEKSAQFKLCCEELDEVTKRRNEIRKAHDEVRKARLNEFMAGFTVICNKLKEMYQMITLGGDAEFELNDSLDPFAEGVVFSVRPPNKSWKEISNLSGGEKTLSSLALVFALHYYRPSPLYVMDEIDAALDYKNVSIVGNYITERTKNAQFIVISLRSNMFELSDMLVGIYKTSNCTKCVTITSAKYATKEKNDDEPIAKQKRRS